MITETLKTWFETLKALLAVRALIIFAALYALLLATLYIFIATREATVWQVVITLAFLVLIPAEFFILQAAILDRLRDHKFQWRGILLDAAKLFVATIPILILGWLLWLLLNKWQVRFPLPRPAITTLAASATAPPQPLHWPTMLFATLRCLLFGVALPLATIHLWIEVTGCDVRDAIRRGGKHMLKTFGSVFGRAFSSDSVLTYALGLVVFVVVPYALLFVPIKITGNKTEFIVFILRLVLVFAFTLIGWAVTIGTLARNKTEAPQAKQNPAPEVSAAEPALQNS